MQNKKYFSQKKLNLGMTTISTVKIECDDIIILKKILVIS